MLGIRLSKLQQDEGRLKLHLDGLEAVRKTAFSSMSSDERALNREEIQDARSDMQHCQGMLNEVQVALAVEKNAGQPEFGNRVFSEGKEQNIVRMLNEPVPEEDLSSRKGGGGQSKLVFLQGVVEKVEGERVDWAGS